jgi:phosphoserine aminotransferase
MYNTPAVFPVYASLLTLQWLKNLGGVAVIEKLNNAKRLYYMRRLIEIHCSKELPLKIVLLNATFLLNDESHAATFDVMWKQKEYLE